MSKLNINEAKLRVQQELQKSLYGAKKGDMLYSKENIDSLEYVTSYGQKEKDSLYVFKCNGHMFLAPSNDDLNPFLGEFEGDNFDLDEMPEHVKDWFLMYAEQIDQYENGEVGKKTDVKYGASDTSYYTDWEDVPVLIPYLWDQGKGYYECTSNPDKSFTAFASSHKKYPYNSSLIFKEIRTDVITYNDDIKVYTGCPTTAFAQILTYWGTVGVNNKTYKVGSKAIAEYNSYRDINPPSNWSQCVSTFKLKEPALPAINEFNYNVANSYYYYYLNGSWNPAQGVTSAQKTNIATIMRYVHQGTQMKASPYASGGQLGPNIIKNAKKYFNWDQFAQTTRTTWSGSESFPEMYSWFLTSNVFKYGGIIARGTISSVKYYAPQDILETLVYRDLHKGIPVIMDATSSSNTGGKDAGHIYVIDGYRKSDRKFHINFGWSGYADGWFNLEAINTDNGYKFNYRQLYGVKFYPNEYYNDFIEVSKYKIIFEKNGGSENIKVISHVYNKNEQKLYETNNSRWNVQNTNLPNWLTLTKDSSSNKSQLKIQASPNTNTQTQTYQVTVYKTDYPSVTDTFTVILQGTEEGTEPSYDITINPTSVTFESTGGTKTVTVTVSPSTTLNVSSSQSWLSVNLSGTTLTLNAQANTETSNKSATVTIKTSDNSVSKTVSVTIKKYVAPTYTLDIEPMSIIVGYSEQTTITRIVQITSNITWDTVTNNKPSWITITKGTNKVTLTISRNEDEQDKSYTFNIKTTGSASSSNITKNISVLVKAQSQEPIITYLKLSANNITLTNTNKTKTIILFTNADYYITPSAPSWLTIQENTTSEQNQKAIVLTTNYNDLNYVEKDFQIKTVDDSITENLKIKSIGIIQNDQTDIVDNIGEKDENDNIIINRNGQNLNIKLHGLNGNIIDTDENKLDVIINTDSTYYDTTNVTTEISGNNLIYKNLYINPNNALTSRLIPIYGVYNYNSNYSSDSEIITFIQKGQVFVIHYSFKNNNTVFPYDVTTQSSINPDINKCELNYWVERTDGSQFYDNNLTLTLSNPTSSYQGITILSRTDNVIDFGDTHNKICTLTIGDNPDNIERMKLLTISFGDISKTLIIKQLSSNQIQLNTFDFFTIEYYIDNDNDNYTSLNNFTNTNQLSSINVYSGEGLQLIATLSAKTETGEDKVINKEINNIVYDLSKLKIGYKQDVNGNNTLYKNYLRYSGQHNYDNENESMLINFYGIIQNLDEEIQEINIDFYGHWTNTRSKSRIKTKINTYKQEPSNIDLYQYRYSVSNTQVQRKENTNYVYDLGNLVEDNLNYYTHVLRLNYNVKTKAGVIYNINEYGNVGFSNNNLIKNIFVFASGYNSYPLISNYLYKETDYEYFMTVYLAPTTSATQIYLNNFIYQTYDKSNNVLSLYQSLSLTNSNITINNNGGLICSLQPSSGPYNYLELGAISIAGTYNIELIITVNSQSNKLILQIIVEDNNII